MPHDHGHSHGHGHHHHHDHDHVRGDHNARPARHLHSHPHEDRPEEDIQALATEFISSFQAAQDKAAYLTLNGIPREIPDRNGGAPLKLVDVQLTTEWQVGTASPSFGSRELTYLPFPGDMIEPRSNLGFVYVSIHRKEMIDLRDVLSERLTKGAL